MVWCVAAVADHRWRRRLLCGSSGGLWLLWRCLEAAGECCGGPGGMSGTWSAAELPADLCYNCRGVR